MTDFKNLHQKNAPLLIGNVWDVPSAKAAEKLNFQAVGTSSAAIAAMLGYADGEEMSFPELEYIVKRIAANTNLPVSVDLESGYSRVPSKIINHIKRLADLGIVGINLEDSIVEEERTLLNAKNFAKTIFKIKNQLEKEQISMFLNVRTDTFLLGIPEVIKETKKRIHLYENAGADGIFTPCIEKEADIESIVKSTNLPINVLSMPNLPDFEKLKNLGVRRISMGNFLHENVYANYEKLLKAILKDHSFQSVFNAET